MRFETAEVSLLGDREENQDRAAIHVVDGSVMLVVADGMGGHAGGALAAETSVESLRASFAGFTPSEDRGEFLRRAIEAAHDAVVAVGDEIGIGSRPRTTCAVCVIGDGRATWAHVGDSRVYVLRDGAILTRTRDHTPIENLLQDGLISEDEVAGHPMRHYVEYCLGGLAERPAIAVSAPLALFPGDVVMLCSDGLWSALTEADIAEGPDPRRTLEAWLTQLAGDAVRYSTPHSDNTTATACRAL